ncbi:hypothetical protein SUGI_0543200 [Cryptomeria japonica]|nr:hypothetical protein SUGI_0543200 [Cryptomeria japonica]
MARLNQSSHMSVFLILLLIVQVWNVSAHIIENDAKYVKTYGAEQGYGVTATINCDKECTRRCSKASLHDRCLRCCGICCSKCNCVPPGTYGNKEVCPCYANMKNSKGGPKCP